MASLPISLIEQLRRAGIIPQQDPKQFMSDANGITGQPIRDPQNDDSGLTVDQSQIQQPMSQAKPTGMPPPPSNLPPQVDLGQAEGNGPGAPPSNMPPPPQLQPTPPPQPSAPPPPALQAQPAASQGPPAPVNLPGASNGTNMPGQVTPEQLINSAYSRMNAPPPKPPSVMRQIAGNLINAAPLGGLGMGPRVEYGKQGLADIQNYQRQQQQIPELQKLAGTAVQLDAHKQAEADRLQAEKDRNYNNQSKVQVSQLNEQSTFVNRDLGQFVPVGSQPPPGYLQVRSAPYDPQGMMRIAPTGEQRQKIKEGDKPVSYTVTPEMANTLGAETGIKAGQTLDPATYKAMLELAGKKIKDPNLHFVTGKTADGDQIITAIDPTKSTVVGTIVVKGAAYEKPSDNTGTWQIQEDTTTGKPVMFNTKTGQTKPADGVQRSGTNAKATAAEEKLNGPARDALAYADTYLASNQPTGPGDEALMEKYFELAKPSTGFRMSQPQQDMLKNSRGVWDSLKAKGSHLANGEWFDTKQRNEIVGAMRDLASAKLKPKSNASSTANGNPVLVKTKAERDALPPGTKYVDSDGNVSTRP